MTTGEQAKPGAIKRRTFGSAFESTLLKIEKSGAVISAAFILIMMVMTTIDTSLRFISKPITGVYELETMMMVVIVYFGLSFIQSQRGHIRMDLLSSKLSESNQLLLNFLSDVIFLCIAVLITWKMGDAAWKAWLTNDYYEGVVRFAMWPAKGAIALGTGLVSIRLISDIIRNPLWFSKTGSGAARAVRILFAVVFIAALAGVAVALINADLKPHVAGYYMLVIFLVFLFIGVPIASGMTLIGIFGFWVLANSKVAMGTASTVPFSAAANYTMTVLPLFIIMGIFAGLAGFAEKGFDMARRWTEGIKGGIIHATVIGSAFFAAATGSGAASCAVLTKLTLPEMLRNGVRKDVGIGVISSAASLAVMIPPSTTFVIYAMLTGNSVGKLLIAGIIPGIIGAAMIMLIVWIRCMLNPDIVKATSVEKSTWKQRFAAIPQAWGLALVIVVIIGGILSGTFTPTEAGAIGAFVTFVAVLILRKGKDKYKEIGSGLADSAGIAAKILFILVGGMLFGQMISVTRLPNMLTEWVVGLEVAPIMIILAIMLVYFILGMFVDALTSMIITLPIIYPIVIGLGYDPLWYGVLMVQNIEIACVTPPYGMNLFIIKGMLPDTSMGTIIRGSVPFLIPLLLTMAVYIAFPQVVLWLPSLM